MFKIFNNYVFLIKLGPQLKVPLDDNDLLYRSIHPIGRVRGGTIYETHPVQAGNLKKSTKEINLILDNSA